MPPPFSSPQVDRFAAMRVKGYTDDLLYLVTKHLEVPVDLKLPNSELEAPEYVDVLDPLYIDKQEVWKKQYAGTCFFFGVIFLVTNPKYNLVEIS
jgi:hypothetical protein